MVFAMGLLRSVREGRGRGSAVSDHVAVVGERIVDKSIGQRL